MKNMQKVVHMLITTGAKIQQRQSSGTGPHVHQWLHPFCRELRRLRATRPKPNVERLQAALHTMLEVFFANRESMAAPWDPFIANFSSLEEYKKKCYRIEKREMDSRRPADKDFVSFMEDGAWDERHTMETLYHGVLQWSRKQWAEGVMRNYVDEFDTKSGKRLKTDDILRIAVMAQGFYINFDEKDFMKNTEYVSTIMGKIVSRAKGGCKAAAYMAYCMQQTGCLTWEQYNTKCWYHNYSWDERQSQCFTTGPNMERIYRHEKEGVPDRDACIRLFRGCRISVQQLEQLSKSGYASCNRFLSFTNDLTKWQFFAQQNPSIKGDDGSKTFAAVLTFDYPLSPASNKHSLAVNNFVRFLASNEYEFICMPFTSWKLDFIANGVDDDNEKQQQQFDRLEKTICGTESLNKIFGNVVYISLTLLSFRSVERCCRKRKNAEVVML